MVALVERATPLIIAVLVTYLHFAMACTDKEHVNIIVILWINILLDDCIVRWHQGGVQGHNNRVHETIRTVLRVRLDRPLNASSQRNLLIAFAILVGILGSNDHQLRLLDDLVVIVQNVFKHVSAHAKRE